MRDRSLFQKPSLLTASCFILAASISGAPAQAGFEWIPSQSHDAQIQEDAKRGYGNALPGQGNIQDVYVKRQKISPREAKKELEQTDFVDAQTMSQQSTSQIYKKSKPVTMNNTRTNAATAAGSGPVQIVPVRRNDAPPSQPTIMAAPYQNQQPQQQQIVMQELPPQIIQSPPQRIIIQQAPPQIVIQQSATGGAPTYHVQQSQQQPRIIMQDQRGQSQEPAAIEVEVQQVPFKQAAQLPPQEPQQKSWQEPRQQPLENADASLASPQAASQAPIQIAPKVQATRRPSAIISVAPVPEPSAAPALTYKQYREQNNFVQDNDAPAPRMVQATAPTPTKRNGQAQAKPVIPMKAAPQGLQINPYPDAQAIAQSAQPQNPITIKRVASKSMPATTQGFAKLSGFGNDMPLAIALQQVIPPAYGYDFGANVDMGARTSWSGGQGWDVVLRNMLAPLGLTADIRSKSVRIEKAAQI